MLLGLPLVMSSCLCRSLLLGVPLSTYREVRTGMKDWLLSDDGDKWSVKFGGPRFGRSLGYYLFRGWSLTLGARAVWSFLG